MALVITRRPGQDFYVGKERFVVDAVSRDNEDGSRNFTLKDERGNVIHVGEDEATEIMPDVFVSAGNGLDIDDCPQDTAAVAIEAPRSIPIVRGELLRRADPS